MSKIVHDLSARIGNPTRSRIAMKSLLIAAAVSIALWFIPYASILTYPIRLMVTFLHEGAHALMALMTGGMVRHIAIHPDGSGVTYTAGGLGIAVASAGYLGATLYGAMLIALVRRGVSGKRLLMVTGGLIAAATLIFVRPWLNIFGFAWGAAIAGGLFLAAARLRPGSADWLSAFIGVQCTLNALFDLKTLLDISTTSSDTPTDAAMMAQYLLLPPAVWALLWITLSLLLLWAVLRPVRPRRTPRRASRK